MAKPVADCLVRLDLNNPVFQQNLLTLQKLERHAALETLNKLRQMTWRQVYQDAGLKWEKIVSIKPPRDWMPSIPYEFPKDAVRRLTVMVNLSAS